VEGVGVIPVVRLYNSQGPHRVAVVYVQEVWGRPGFAQIQVARGPNRTQVAVGETHGPFPASDLDAQHGAVLAALRAQGFRGAGLDAIRANLHSTQPNRRANAAARLGWRREADAVPDLLVAASLQGTELSTVVDALGRVGDARGVPLARSEAARKLLSRRRSGVEALRSLGDTVGLDTAAHDALGRLPPGLASLVQTTAPGSTDPTHLAAFEAAVKPLPPKELGPALDALYELATPLTVAVTRVLLRRVQLQTPHLWRYVKSVFKRAMVRGDHATFALIVWRIERASDKARGISAQLKSGRDGVTRQTQVFFPGTQKYLKRLAWRYLKTLARWRPSEYPFAAAHILAEAKPDDRQQVKRTTVDGWQRRFVFNHVLRGGNARYSAHPRSLLWQVMPVRKGQRPLASDARTESFPELWDATPRAYLVVLARTEVPEVLDWAFGAVKSRGPSLLDEAPHADLIAMLAAPHTGVANLSLDALERRFHPASPDLDLLDALCRDGRPFVRDRAVTFLGRAASSWTRQLDRVMAWLALPDAALRSTVATLVLAALDDADLWYRRELSERVLSALQAPESSEGAHDGLARVARDGLRTELTAVLSLDEVLALLHGGEPAVQGLAGALLGHYPEARGVLGPVRIAAMARHEVAAVREGAYGLIRQSLDEYRDDPSLLFLLVESEWADARAFAFELLRGPIDLEPLGLAGILGLCDSTRPDVQAFGRERALAHFATLDSYELLQKLAEHPSPSMRRFAVDLIVGHLKPGFVPLARVEGVFRAALLDLTPSRMEKRAVCTFLRDRALRDERQAEVGLRVFGELARSKTRADREAALDALAALVLKFPHLESPLRPHAPQPAAPEEAAP